MGGPDFAAELAATYLIYVYMQSVLYRFALLPSMQALNRVISVLWGWARCWLSKSDCKKKNSPRTLHRQLMHPQVQFLVPNILISPTKLSLSVARVFLFPWATVASCCSRAQGRKSEREEKEEEAGASAKQSSRGLEMLPAVWPCTSQILLRLPFSHFTLRAAGLLRSQGWSEV